MKDFKKARFWLHSYNFGLKQLFAAVKKVLFKVTKYNDSLKYNIKSF